ncbi:putative DNA damage-regulated autophagy modulator protein 2-like [Apostichopus japonicus]|uniref:Putative DNA damage-regulated autophagy modulator protein 2-like n=1 Tax=Stichopus japonicus TaxID=307972 RepID=A0A2G8JDB0_STIJA|nr:putative DNA damage-regulated autophagy modulator protein 2-like [Apostichopus japonicus]
MLFSDVKALACIFIRFKQVGIAAEGNNSVSLLNRVGFVLGIIACFGMSLVANFQELNVASVHMIGAMLCFGVGSVYTILHTWITFKLRNRGSITCLRLFLSVSCSFLFIITMVYTTKALNMHAGLNPLIWHDTDDGFVLHQVATSSEWLLAISFLVYFWTFIPDFRWMTVAVEVQHSYLRIPG